MALIPGWFEELANQRRLIPGDVVANVGRGQLRVTGVREPGLRKEGEDLGRVRFGGRRGGGGVGKTAEEGGGKVGLVVRSQMAELCGARVELDQVGVAGGVFDHEIKAAEAGEAEVADEQRAGARDGGRVKRADDGGGAEGVLCGEDLDGELAEDAALPAGAHGVGGAAGDPGLHGDPGSRPGGGVTTFEEGKEVVLAEVTDDGGGAERPLKCRVGGKGLRPGVHDADAGTGPGIVGLEDPGEGVMDAPVCEVGWGVNGAGLGRADAKRGGEGEQAASIADGGVAGGVADRALDEGGELAARAGAGLFLGV